MSKVFHLAYILLWSNGMLYAVDKIQYQADYGMVHVLLLIFSSMCAGFQFYDLANEIIKGE
jgi:hypothetical protein